MHKTASAVIAEARSQAGLVVTLSFYKVGESGGILATNIELRIRTVSQAACAPAFL
jgi:hypothetical protein